MNTGTQNKTLSFRQLLKTLQDCPTQDAAVNVDASTISGWGVIRVWFEDGVLSIGCYDDEGMRCEALCSDIAECIPSEMLDKPVVVKVGRVDWDDPDESTKLFDENDNEVDARMVKFSEIEPDPECECFCSWIIS